MAFIKKKDRQIIPSEGFEEMSTPDELIKLAEKNGIKTDPINVTELAMVLGISIIYEPMPDDDSGSLKIDKKTGSWVMTVNSLHHPHRQRFTIAHELGHRVKHAREKSLFEDKTFFRNGDSNIVEAQANRFAAELLMPNDVFAHFIEKVSSKVEDIADHFQVSSMAVRIRAKHLGYEGHNL